MPVKLHADFANEHKRLRELGAAVEIAIGAGAEALPAAFGAFRDAAAKAFRRLDRYYERVDRDRRIPDRVLMHDLRNDHAAVVFTLESLQIRLKKNGLNDDWRKKWGSLTGVLWPYLERLPRQLFPLGESHLTAEDASAILIDPDEHA